MGRTVVSNSLETPLAGVTVSMMGLDGSGNSTGCTGTTDGAGNFALTGLASNCVGPQLVAYNGNSVTSPAGKYAGVNLVYTLVSGQVSVSPVLVHLPRIDTAETFQVQQNASTDQTYSFASVPGVTVTVYAHTTFTQEDGTQPNPFPLVAVEVPVDRLPEAMPTLSTGVIAFIVAFQPANVVSSQPVAVSYPNTLKMAAGTTGAPLMTLDPTRGRMVPYGTATVSADGTQIIPDIDPSTGSLQHRFGIVNFDWHGGVAAALTIAQVADGCGMLGGPYAALACAVIAAAVAAEPVDLSSGVHVMHVTDMSISGPRGSIAVQRTYRSLTSNTGSFGLGNELQYVWQLDTSTPASVSAVNLASLPQRQSVPVQPPERQHIRLHDRPMA